MPDKETKCCVFVILKGDKADFLLGKLDNSKDSCPKWLYLYRNKQQTSDKQLSLIDSFDLDTDACETKGVLLDRTLNALKVYTQKINTTPSI